MKPRKLLSLNAWPVVQRELREGARRPFNYWLRVAAAAAGLLMVVYITQKTSVAERLMGRILFLGLHVLLMGMICLVVPWMTADCIAREKREGTLGLLFLTPLTAGGIVVGKGLAQALRALTLWVSLAPVLTIPFVMGGIGWDDACAALALEFSALVLCLAAGLLASMLVKKQGVAIVLALLFGAFFVSGLCVLACLWFLIQTPSSVAEFNLDMRDISEVLMHHLDPEVFVDFSTQSPRAIATASHLWHQTLWASPIPASLLFIIVLRFAAWRMAATWQDKIPSPRQESLTRKYCTPLFQRWFAYRTRSTLDRNPIAWLQQYSWKARLGKWALCLAFVVIITTLLFTGRIDYSFGETTEFLLLLTLAAGMTFAGINSFAQEKRSGALELILTTPVSVNQIIFGRVLGLWKQFLPAALMLAGFDAGLIWMHGSANHLIFGTTYDAGFDLLRDCFPDRLLVVSIFATLPVFSLYFALRIKNLIVAAGLTWAAMCLPVLFLSLWFLLVYRGDTIADIWVSAALCLANGLLALLACFLLRHSLSRRIYSF